MERDCCWDFITSFHFTTTIWWFQFPLFPSPYSFSQSAAQRSPSCLFWAQRPLGRCGACTASPASSSSPPESEWGRFAAAAAGSAHPRNSVQPPHRQYCPPPPPPPQPMPPRRQCTPDRELEPTFCCTAAAAAVVVAAAVCPRPALCRRPPHCRRRRPPGAFRAEEWRPRAVECQSARRGPRCCSLIRQSRRRHHLRSRCFRLLWCVG